MTTPRHLLERCKTLAGSYTRSHQDCRTCSFCGLRLTDPASWERGIGPICARNSTTIFAKQMKFQGSYALAHLFAIKAEAMPEEIRSFWQTEFVPVALDILKVACSSTSALETHGVDLRDLAKVVAWILSYRIDRKTKVSLVNFVKFLGFVGYASVLAGDASTGPATISFNETTGRVELVGSRCNAGMKELRATIRSVLFPSYTNKSLSAGAQDAGAFCDLAIQYWPMVSGDTKEIQEKAAKWLEAHPQAVKVAKAVAVSAEEAYSPQSPVVKPKATFIKKGAMFSVHLDWANEVYAVVGDIKNIVPRKQRKYNSASLQWDIDSSYFDKIVEVVRTKAPNHSVVVF